MEIIKALQLQSAIGFAICAFSFAIAFSIVVAVVMYLNYKWFSDEAIRARRISID